MICSVEDWLLGRENAQINRLRIEEKNTSGVIEILLNLIQS